MLRVQVFRVLFFHLRARAALAAAAEGKNVRFIRMAAADAKRIRREKIPAAQALARLIEASQASLRGQADLAAQSLRIAIAELEQIPMSLFAATAKARLGRLLGSDSEGLSDQAIHWMQEQSIKCPARTIETFAPGLPRVE